MSTIEYLLDERVRSRLISTVNYLPDWITIPLPVGHRCLMWLRLTPAELRYLVPDKEGGVEPAFIDRISVDSCVIDAGAHLGYYSLVAANYVGDEGDVVAFEPHPDHATRMRRNVRWNGADVRVEEAAVSDNRGTADLRISDRGGGHTLGDGEKTVETPKTTIDHVREDSGIDPDVIKFDIEGAELRGLTGMAQTLQESRPTIICEVHPWGLEQFGDSVAEFYSLLDSYGYRILSLPEEEELSESTFVEKSNEGSVNEFGMQTKLHVVAEPR